MMTNSTTDLRAVLHRLADLAPAVDDLDHSAWAEPGSANGSRRRRPGGRTVLAAIAAAAAVVALIAVAVKFTDGRNDSSPPAGGAAVLEVRPLVAPAVLITSAEGAQSADPLRGLDFPVPESETEYDALSAAQQHQLLTALAMTACDSQIASAAPVRVACSTDLGGQRIGYLLGPSIFGDAQISAARAVPPSLPGGSTEWTVAITLNDEGAAAWTRYTTAHHSGSPNNVDSPLHCASTATPCADYTAFVIDGSAQSVPITLAPLGRDTQISGNFTEHTASTLAQELRP